MADAKTAILVTLDSAHEGGFQKNYNDRANWTGGEVGEGTLVGTNGGITALDLPGQDIEHLTEEQKIAYYLENYWKPLYSQIKSQLVASKLFDMGILFGVGTAVKSLQIALGIVKDGIFGPATLAELNNTTDEAEVMAAFREQMEIRARTVAEASPLEAPALPDWLRRIAS